MVRNYLFCGPKIIERLQEKVPEFLEVLSAADLSTAENDDPATPNAYVVYNGDITGTSPSATGGNLKLAQYINQLWIVMICVYLPDSRGLGEYAGEEGGELITKVINALTGWSPDPKACLPMSRHSQSLPTQYENGFAYFPLVFQVGIPHVFFKG
ncbi:MULTISPECIES: phage tail terminator protein [Providencia]|uniref:phage tail terminator protein n=1 Tax=Providencia TaxID=586 RepID=UPI001408EADB